MKITCFQDRGMTFIEVSAMFNGVFGGFTVWEPFIDVTAVLMRLLELSSDPNLYAAG